MLLNPVKQLNPETFQSRENSFPCASSWLNHDGTNLIWIGWFYGFKSYMDTPQKHILTYKKH